MQALRSTQWRSDTGGSMAVAFALVLPIIVMVVGGAVDFTLAMQQKNRLQTVVDASALAAARELGLSDAKRENVAAAVEAMVKRSMLVNAATLEVETVVRDEPLEVQVVARQEAFGLFGGFGLGALDLEAAAVARIIGKPNICVLGLDPSANGAISLEKNARVTGRNCAVFSNSTHSHSIKSKDSAVLSASMICTAGGKDGDKGNFAPEPLTDCPTFDDPLAGRPEPLLAPCNSSLPTQVTASRALAPGVYCGGLTIGSGADVALDPGIYVIRDGPLRVADGGKLAGKGVGFHLIGSGAVLLMERGSSIDLAAPTSGLMAGLLVFEGRSQPTTGVHRILSDDARNLLGTIYVSRGQLHVDANKPVADESAYTAIVARVLTLYGGPHLVLNSNYDQTDVPVPAGIRGANQPVALVR